MFFVYLSALETEEQRDKFEMLYDKYRGLMYYETGHLVSDPELREDAVHETFLHLIKIIDLIRVDNARELTSFICIITRNRTIDYLRRVSRQRSGEQLYLDELADLPASDPEEIALDGLVLQEAIERVKELSDDYRTPLELKVQGYKIEEIARFMNVSQQVVKVRIHRARKKLIAMGGNEDV